MSSAKNAFSGDRFLTGTLIFSVLMFVLLAGTGLYGPDLMANGLCYRYLGCNTGFFGFDAVVHLASGITETLLALWLMRRFPSISLLHSSFWKNLVIIVSLAVLFAFIWEFLEFVPDHYRVFVLHINLFSPNRLYQPDNTDTMGDMVAALLGAILIAPFFIRSVVARSSK